MFSPNNSQQIAWNQIPNIGIIFPKPLLPTNESQTAEAYVPTGNELTDKKKERLFTNSSLQQHRQH